MLKRQSPCTTDRVYETTAMVEQLPCVVLSRSKLDFIKIMSVVHFARTSLSLRFLFVVHSSPIRFGMYILSNNYNYSTFHSPFQRDSPTIAHGSARYCAVMTQFSQFMSAPRVRRLQNRFRAFSSTEHITVSPSTVNSSSSTAAVTTTELYHAT